MSHNSAATENYYYSVDNYGNPAAATAKDIAAMQENFAWAKDAMPDAAVGMRRWLEEAGALPQRGPSGIKGSAEFPPGEFKTLIRGYEAADLSTFVHEVGHNLRRNLHPDDQVIAETHYKVKDGKWTRKQEEKFARDFERYLRDGKTPNPKLVDVFAKISAVMRSIYKTLRGTPLYEKIAPEIRDIFDRATGKPDLPAAIDISGGVPKISYAQAKLRGEKIMAAHENAPVVGMAHYTANRADVINKAYDAAQGEWGGVTYDPRTGNFVSAADGKPGPFASSVGKTVSLSVAEASDKALFAKAMKQVINDNRDLLNRDGYYLGVFHDVTAGRVDFDVNLLVHSAGDASALQTALGRQGGAYDFTTGNAVWGVKPDRAPISFRGADTKLLAERDALQAEIKSTTEQINQTQNDIKEVRARAQELRQQGTTLHESFQGTNPDGTAKTSYVDKRRVEDYTNWVRENYPAYEVVAGPRMMNHYTPDNNFLKNLMVEHAYTGQAIMEWGPVSRMANALDSLTRPIRGRIESKSTAGRFYEVMMKLGAEKDQVDHFLQGVNDTLANVDTLGFKGERIPLTRGMNGMGAGQLARQGVASFGKNTAFVEAFGKRFGGQGFDRMFVPISEAYNPVVRATQRALEQGKPTGRIARVLTSAYDAYHTQPGFQGLSAGTHRLAKWVYPLVRFALNPMYHVYNATESDIIGVTQDGLRAARLARVSPYHRRGCGTVVARQRAGFSGDVRCKARRAPGNMGLNPDASRKQSPHCDGCHPRADRRYLRDQHAPAAIIARQVDLRRPETIMDAIHQFPETDPAMLAIRKRYGGTPEDWVNGLTQDLYGVDQVGVKKYIGDLVNQEGWTAAEQTAMAPLLNDIVIKMQRQFDDLYQMHVGNVDRSRLERVVNSYWLFWPASYMLKANKWMFSVLTEGAFGFKSGLGGAWALQELAKHYHQQYINDPQFRKLVDDNKDLEFALSQMLPVVPWSDGVSLNRLTRYVGGGLLWPQYSNFDPLDVTAWGSKMSDIGPLYSIKLDARREQQSCKGLQLAGWPIPRFRRQGTA